MDPNDLLATNKAYTASQSDWAFHLAAYQGTKGLVNGSYFTKHERESDKNFERRQKNALSFGYSESVVSLFCQYLFAKPAVREFGALGESELFAMFLADCDQFGSNWDTWMLDAARWASVYGHVGLLVDAPQVETQTAADALANGVYPYVVRYAPTAILDWRYGRNEWGRLRLDYLKVKDDDNVYRLFWPGRVEVWRYAHGDREPVKLSGGTLPTAEIPFVFLYSAQSTTRGIGVSDIDELARLDLATMNAISQGDEIIDYSAFPMMRAPYPRAGEADKAVGPKAILWFDPELGEAAKPDWLASDSKPAIEAVQQWVELKRREVYRSCHAASVAGVEGREARSGIALRMEFMELGARLAEKASQLQEAENHLLRWWGQWMGLDTADVSVAYPHQFDIDDLTADLANLLTGKALVTGSETFSREVQKRTARSLLPDLPEETAQAIADEIDAVPSDVVDQQPGETADGTGDGAATGPDTLVEGEKLNGAQIQAAKDVADAVTMGMMAPAVAVELLAAVGIELARANRMVKAAAAFTPAKPIPVAAPAPTEGVTSANGQG